MPCDDDITFGYFPEEGTFSVGFNAPCSFSYGGSTYKIQDGSTQEIEGEEARI